MERVRLGATGLEVSRLGLGTMTFANPVDEEGSRSLLDCAVEHGVDFLDTANMYSAGRSEEILGRWLRDRGDRERLVVASKVRYAVGGDRRTAGLSPRVVVQQVEASLRRLGTDWLDILYLHQPDDDTPLEVTWRCLQDLVSAGKVRTVGLSNFAAWQVTDAHALARSRGWVLPLVLQPMYNLLARRVEDELLPAARHHDLGVCAYNPLAGGLLTGKHESLPEPKSESRLARNAYYRERYWHPRLREAASRLLSVAQEGGRSLVSLSLRFLLDSPETHCILVGATSREQLEETLACPAEKPLTPDERAACDEIWSDLSGPIPRYHRSNEDDIF